MAKSGEITRTDDVYQALRADILGARMVSGDRLKFPDLADLTAARVEIESLVLNRSALEGDMHW